jgi:multiple sugar transport system permease protein
VANAQRTVPPVGFETSASKTTAWHKTRSGRTRIGHLLLHIVLVLFGLTALTPLLWVMSTSLKLPGDVFTYPIEWIPDPVIWSNYPNLLTVLEFSGKPAIVLFAQNTFFIALLATLGTIFSSIFVAYSFARLRWPERDFVFSLALATMMLPGVVTLVPMFLIFRSLDWLDTFLPLIVPHWFAINGFYIFLLRQFFMSLPSELEEAARIDGASSFRILWQVIVPLSAPAIVTVAIFSFLQHYNDFIHPLLYLNTTEKFTLPLGLLMFQGRFGDRWPTVMAASTVVIVPPILLFLFLQRYFVRGIHLTGLAGR